MFYELEMQSHIRLPPGNFDDDLSKALKEKLNEKYEGKIDKENGMVITVKEILGVGDKTGSLKEGKEATLFVSQGDALDFRTNKLSYAYIQGKEIILDNKQEALFERYSKKYGND